MADEPKVKVAFTENCTDTETLINYWRGDVVELPPENAGRIVGKGCAVFVEKEELQQQNVDELKETADALGVDVSGKQKKEEIVKEIAKK